MPYYKVCPYCGSNLDPGETCDCQREKQKGEGKKPQIKITPKKKAIGQKNFSLLK